MTVQKRLLLSIDEVSELLDVPKPTLYRSRLTGKGPPSVVTTEPAGEVPGSRRRGVAAGTGERSRVTAHPTGKHYLCRIRK